MQATLEVEPSIRLDLSRKEAEWLRDYMQNWLGPANNEEPSDSRYHRTGLFNVLKYVLDRVPDAKTVKQDRNHGVKEEEDYGL